PDTTTEQQHPAALEAPEKTEPSVDGKIPRGPAEAQNCGQEEQAEEAEKLAPDPLGPIGEGAVDGRFETSPDRGTRPTQLRNEGLGERSEGGLTTDAIQGGHARN
ncbi:MAG: hypothetical protein ABI647_12505, partial [Gemmatimonadota bacterium]